MKPALSVIVFTVLSGAGLGLAVAIAVMGVTVEFGYAGGLSDRSTALAMLVAWVMVVAGLCSSVLHLANPRNAWRAFSQFRRSWLAREAIFAVLFLALAMAFAAAFALTSMQSLRIVLGVLVIGSAWAVLYSTAMIYGCLRTIPLWNSSLTPWGYLALGHYSGLLVFAAILTAEGAASQPVVLLTLVALAVAAIVKLLHFRRAELPGGGDVAIAHAIGVGGNAGRAGGLTAAGAKLLDVGHTHGTFLTREFLFSLDRRRAVRLRYLFAVLSFAIPLATLGADVIGAPIRSVGLWATVAIVALAGLLVERWLFFAEARHVVRLYHGDAGRRA